jgi:hypothetical protein
VTAGQSAEAWARATRAAARKGLWRRLLAALGLSPAAARADALAARRERGAEGEKETARLLAPLASEGWYIRHDLSVPRRRFNLDHVLVTPCGTGMVVPDSKRWFRTWPTVVRGGRLHCGMEDRHKQVEDLVEHAEAVAAAVGVPAGRVMPLVVVHGSPVAGGMLRVRVAGRAEPVAVIGPELLVAALRQMGLRRDPRAARALAERVDAVLTPYVQKP